MEIMKNVTRMRSGIDSEVCFMNEITPDRNQDIICYCSGTTFEQIKALIDDGISNLERISRITGACSGCGGCESKVQELLAECG